MKQPWMQFYTRDWLDNKELRRCSPAARSVLADLMCLAHEGYPYGYLADKVGGLTEVYLASRCVVSVDEFRAAIAELRASGERISVKEDGTIYIPRMVEDAALRAKRAEGGKKGGNPNLVKGKVGGKVNLVVEPLSDSDYISGSSLKTKKEEPEKVVSLASHNKDPSDNPYDPTADWPKFTKVYPSHRINEYMDLRVWMGVVTSAEMATRIVAKVEKFKRSVKWADPQYVPGAAKFLGERIFETDPGPSAPAPRTQADIMAAHKALLREITGDQA